MVGKILNRDKKILKRDVNIELIRVLACVSVIALHTWKGSGIDEIPITVKGVIRMFQQHGVPLFLLIMGFFLFNGKKTFGQKVKETLVRIIIPSFIVLILYDMFWPWLIGDKCLSDRGGINSQNILYSVIRFVRGNYSPVDHLWYIFAYCEIIVFFPLMNLVCVKEKKVEKIRRGYMLLCIINKLLENCFFVINQLGNTEFGIVHWSPFNQYMLYVLFGYELHILIQCEQWIKLKKTGLRWMFLTIYVITNFTICAEEFVAIKVGIETEYFYHNSVLHYISSISIFLFLMCIPITNEKQRNVIRWTADKSFYIYLIHFAGTLLVGSYGMPRGVNRLPSLLKYMVCVIAIFVISLLIATAIKTFQSCIRRKKWHEV